MKKYRIDENNSGGRWWMKRSDYESLFKAGWKVDEEFMKKDVFGASYSEPWLADRGDTVPYGWRNGAVYLEADTIREAVDSFNANTSQYFWSQGCNCCGVPFTITTGYDSKDYESISGYDADIRISEPW